MHEASNPARSTPALACRWTHSAIPRREIKKMAIKNMIRERINGGIVAPLGVSPEHFFEAHIASFAAFD